MPLHERSHQGKTNAEAIHCERLVRSHLGEHVEDLFERRRRNADAVVLHGHYRLTVLAIEREVDAPAGLRLLLAIEEQVREHLRQAIGVAVDPEVLDPQIKHQFVLVCLDEDTR